MKKAIIFPLLAALTTMSIRASAQNEVVADAAPVDAPAAAPSEAIIDLPPMIDPNNVDDQKLGEIIETLRQSRQSAVYSLGDKVGDASSIIAAGSLGSLAGSGTSYGLARLSTAKNLSPKLVQALQANGRALYRFADSGMHVALVVLGAGIAIKVYEITHKPSTKDSALMMQSSTDLDALFKHSNQEIVAAANRDAKLKKQLLNMYQAILIINQPVAK